MKILRVILSANPKDGGAVESMLRSALAMPAHQTEVVSLDDPSASFIAEFPLKLHALGPVAKKYGYTPKLTQWLQAHASEFDAAVIEGVWNHASVEAARQFKKLKIPYVLYTHGMLDPWFRKTYPLKHLAKQVLWLFGQGQALSNAFSVLFTCEEEMKLARGEFWGHRFTERVISFGTTRPPKLSPEMAPAFRAKCPDLADKRYLLFLSRLHPKKGCDVLISAFSKIAAKFPDIDLVMAGPDQVGDQASLAKLTRDLQIEERVHWPGMLSGDAKWGALYGAHAMTLTSHQENFGIVVAEAMACGSPVLISNKVNIWREVESSGGGLVANDDIEGSAQMLEAFLSKADEQRQAMSAAAIEAFETRFEIGAAVRDLEAVLLEARQAI